jgi:hypothetical protein
MKNGPPSTETKDMDFSTLYSDLTETNTPLNQKLLSQQTPPFWEKNICIVPLEQNNRCCIIC